MLTLEEISIHAPRTGSDLQAEFFLWLEKNFNPRSPHGERRRNQAAKRREGGISIHAPRTGSDLDDFTLCLEPQMISIHAPRTGSDVCVTHIVIANSRISIHAPRTGSD